MHAGLRKTALNRRWVTRFIELSRCAAREFVSSFAQEAAWSEISDGCGAMTSIKHSSDHSNPFINSQEILKVVRFPSPLVPAPFTSCPAHGPLLQLQVNLGVNF
jgi:hypothetical protein